jgi:hypothetical protein
LACFGDGFGGSGSFLNIGSHYFYIAKPFQEEVIDILNPLSDGGSSCGESCDFGAMVEVMALGEEEESDPPRSVRSPLECLPPQEQNVPLPEQDTSDVAVVDLRAPLDRVIDPTRVAEALERMCLVLLSRAAGEEAARHHMSTTLRGSSTTRVEMRRTSLSAASSAAMDSTPWAATKSSGRHRQARALEGADRAVAPQAVTPEDALLSWEFRDSSHGEAYRRGSTLVTMGPARDCAKRDTSVYPGSGPSRLEVNLYFLPASY